MTNFVL